MNKQFTTKFNWRLAFGIAVVFGAFGIIESPAAAEPGQTSEELKISQVGVRGRITPPTPINLRPRTHIPLPASDFEQQYDYYGNPIYENSRRGRRRFRRGFRGRRGGFGRRRGFGRGRRFGRGGHNNHNHRRHNRFRGNHHGRNHGGFGKRGLIIKKKF